jgi:hypothetical protein
MGEEDFAEVQQAEQVDHASQAQGTTKAWLGDDCQKATFSRWSTVITSPTSPDRNVWYSVT